VIVAGLVVEATSAAFDVRGPAVLLKIAALSVIYLLVLVAVKEVSGTPTVTGTVSVGVAPSLVANLVRPTGETFPPLTAAATLYSASINLGTTATTHVNPAVAPTTNTDWGPFYVTVTPTANLSVAGGSVDIFVTAEFEGEHQEVAPIYSEFNASKYKN
jgi:hypothetical protein